MKILGFVARHELAIDLFLFALWLQAIVFGNRGPAENNHIPIPHQARWFASALIAFMLLRELRPYREARARYLEARRSKHGPLLELDPAKQEEFRLLVAKYQRPAPQSSAGHTENHADQQRR